MRALSILVDIIFNFNLRKKIINYNRKTFDIRNNTYKKKNIELVLVVLAELWCGWFGGLVQREKYAYIHVHIVLPCTYGLYSYTHTQIVLYTCRNSTVYEYKSYYMHTQFVLHWYTYI